MRALPVKAMGLAPEASSPRSPRSLQAAASQRVFLLLKVNMDRATSPVPTASPYFRARKN